MKSNLTQNKDVSSHFSPFFEFDHFQLSSDQNLGPLLYIGDEIIASYIGMIMSEATIYKDPVKSQPVNGISGIVECSTFRWSRLWVVGGDGDGDGGVGCVCEEPQSFAWKNQHFMFLSESWCWPPSSTENLIFGGCCKFFPSLFRDHFVGKGAPQESLPRVRVKLVAGVWLLRAMGNHWRLSLFLDGSSLQGTLH